MQRKILLDTNSYLRLGLPFHPLVMAEIPGEQGGLICILPNLKKEIARGVRLRNDFAWALEHDTRENRDRCIMRFSASQRAEIQRTFDFALSYAQRTQNGASYIDIHCLAVGFTLGIPVVTDDGDMMRLAADFDIHVLSTIELLKIMVDAGFCAMEKVRSTIRYWIYVSDLPRNYRSDYRRVFGEEPPDSA